MVKARPFAVLSACVWLLLAGSGCVHPASTREPLNLSAAKAAVIAYHDSGHYLEDVAAVTRQAEDWLRQRAQQRRPGERLAVVFDIDETVLSNYPHMVAQDFGHVSDAWNAWVAAAAAPALEPVRGVYQVARELDVDVIFITGRRDPGERPGTETNLQRQGMGDFARLILAPATSPHRTAAARKAAARAALEAEGWTIVASIGDQESDLAGGHAERTFKLPNPFYRIP